MLGVQVWHRQADILEAIRDQNNIAIRSGHKCGKSNCVVCAALWFVCTRKRGRVILTSSSDDQIRNILWKELTRIYTPVKNRIGGDLALDHRTGLRFPDGREIIGLATKKPENMAGLSGPEMLFIADEASGIDEAIFEAIEGNRAGGAPLVMISNPTRPSGKFYDAFHSQREFWHCLHMSSEEAASVGIPGLATEEYVAQRKVEWGVDSPIYQVRVAGNFAAQSEYAVIGLGLVEAGSKRWPTVAPYGRLHIGVDVARFGDDSSIICARRGMKAFPMHELRGADTVAVAGRAIALAREMRAAEERPVIKVDTIGVGGGVADNLRKFATGKHREIDLVEVNCSERAPADDEYNNLRSQLWFGVADWLKAGGAIPDDDRRLEAELVAPEYKFDSRGRRVVESKDEIKKRIKRSPDRADALALAVWSKEPITQSGPTRLYRHDIEQSSIG